MTDTTLLELERPKQRANHSKKAGSPSITPSREEAHRKLNAIFGTPIPIKESTSRASTINLPPKLPTYAETASAKTQREIDLEDLEEITNLVKAGQPLKSAILHVRTDVAEILEDKTQQERSLIGELTNGKQISAKINNTFRDHYGKEYNENIYFRDVLASDKLGIFSISITKIGKTELCRKQVDLMIADPAQRPIPYLKRSAVNGKKQTLQEFFDATYGEFRDANAIYLNEIRLIDPDLYRNLGSVGKHITATMKKCKDQVNDDIALVANVSARAHRVLKSSYGK